MEDLEKDGVRLPDNAFRELKEGEEYRPVMDPRKAYPEVNGWSVTWGVLMTMLFSAAAAYLGLRVGQVFEAAIPIAIIAVGVSTAAKRRNPLGENVIIQSIGACSGAVVAGAIFTLPAIYILEDKYPGMGASFLEIFLSFRSWEACWAYCSSYPSASISSATCTASTRSPRLQPPRRCS